MQYVLNAVGWKAKLLIAKRLCFALSSLWYLFKSNSKFFGSIWMGTLATPKKLRLILRISASTRSYVMNFLATITCNGRTGNSTGLQDRDPKPKGIYWQGSLTPMTNQSYNYLSGLSRDVPREQYTKPPNETFLFNWSLFILCQAIWILDFNHVEKSWMKTSCLIHWFLETAWGVHLTLTCCMMHGHGCYLYICDEGMSAGSNWQWECVSGIYSSYRVCYFVQPPFFPGPKPSSLKVLERCS